MIRLNSCLIVPPEELAFRGSYHARVFFAFFTETIYTKYMSACARFHSSLAVNPGTILRDSFYD